MKSTSALKVTAVSAVALLPFISLAATSYTVTAPTADAFLAAGSPSNPVGTNLASMNFGGAGTLAVAPASSTKGEFDSILKFNVASAVSQFNTAYGAGNWSLTGVTLTLGSNFGDQGEQPNNGIFNTINAGSFGIDWLGNDSWVEGTGGGNGTPGYPNNSMVSYNSIGTLFSGGSASLGTYSYTPPGDNIALSYTLPLNASLLADLAAGGDVSLYFFAADDQVGYLFNSRSYASNRPQLTLVVAPIPEPGVLSLGGLALGAVFLGRRRRIRR